MSAKKTIDDALSVTNPVDMLESAGWKPKFHPRDRNGRFVDVLGKLKNRGPATTDWHNEPREKPVMSKGVTIGPRETPLPSRTPTNISREAQMKATPGYQSRSHEGIKPPLTQDWHNQPHERRFRQGQAAAAQMIADAREQSREKGFQGYW